MLQQIKLSSENEFQLMAEELSKVFSEEFLEKLARHTGFVKRKSKLSPIDFVAITSFLERSGGQKTLNELCAILSSKRNIQLSTEGLNQRLSPLGVTFLKELFLHLFKQKLFPTSLIPTERNLDFYRIRILDSTTFELPGTYGDDYKGFSKSGVKIQLEYDLLNGEFLHLDVQNGRDNDANYAKAIQDTVKANDLFLRDLGYFSVDLLKQINGRDAYYISRMKSNLVVYQLKNNGVTHQDFILKKAHCFQKLDIVDIIEKMAPGELIELKDIYLSCKKVYQPRMIIYKMTENEAKERGIQLDKKAKRKGVTLTSHTLKLKKANIYISNIPHQCVSREEIHEIYSLRWQIEILFKTWKSLFHLHQIKNVKKERFECHLYGTLIALLLSSSIAYQIKAALYKKEQLEASEFKSIAIVKEFMDDIYQALYQLSPKSIERCFRQIYQLIRMNGRKSHRYEKKTVFDIMLVNYNLTLKKIA